MFPSLRVRFRGLRRGARYAVAVDMAPVDGRRYRYSYSRSAWVVVTNAPAVFASTSTCASSTSTCTSSTCSRSEHNTRETLRMTSSGVSKSATATAADPAVSEERKRAHVKRPGGANARELWRTAEFGAAPRCHVLPGSPLDAETLEASGVSFERLKLTNNEREHNSHVRFHFSFSQHFIHI